MTTIQHGPAAAGDASPPAADAVPRDRRARHWELGAIDTVGVVIPALLTVALAPGFYWVLNPRQALVLATLPLGTWLLARRAILGRDPAAVAAWLFVAVATIAALRAGDYVAITIFGAMTTELSVLAYLAAFGWWAIGRELTSEGRRLLPIGLTIGYVVNLAVGLFQMFADPATGIYHTFSGRASGLMSNPVYFASTFVGLWAYWFVRSAQSSTRERVAMAALVAFGVGLSGSRGAIAVAVFVIAVTAIRHRRAVVLTAGASLVGFGLGVGLLSVISGTRSQSERLGDVDGGLSLRSTVWRAALDAWSERPLLGWGPHPFQIWTNMRLDEETVAREGRLTWTDPHNVFVIVLVTTGLIGLIVVAAFVFTALRGRVDAALFAAAVAIVLSWMLQPVVINGWPLAFAFFGAAVRPRGDERRAGRELGPPVRAWTTVAVVSVGVAVGLAFAVWSVRLQSALASDLPDVADDRAGWLINEPTVAANVAESHKEVLAEGAELDRHLARAGELAELSIERSGQTTYWELLAAIRLHQEDYVGANEVVLAWVDEWPNDILAYQVLGLTASLVGDAELEAFARERSCDFDSALCDLGSGG